MLAQLAYVALLACAALPAPATSHRIGSTELSDVGAAAEEVEEEAREPCSGSASSVRMVHVLYARTGLSCANAVSKLSASSWSPFQQSTDMVDPLLSDGGVNATLETGLQVQKWLDSAELALDAVLASSLSRAIETAALQFRGNEVFSVPFAIGRSKYKDSQAFDVQAKRIGKHLERYSQVRASQRWRKVFSSVAQGGPVEFERFLARSFLPSLVRKLNRSHADPIVLAVVTHSNFLAGFDDCKYAYGYRPTYSPDKPNLNQVIRLEYKFVTDSPAEDCVDSTPRYSLVRGACSAVVEGTKFFQQDGKPRPHCYRDLGEWCREKVPEGVEVPFLEDDLDRKQRAVDAAKVNVQEASADLREAQEKLESFDPEKDGGQWWNPMKTTKHDLEVKVDAARALVNIMRARQQRREHEFGELEQLRCFDGGLPDRKSS